ncbi:hypothetical protein E4T56_gene20315 [Termitomyces sp. T112]|nr:hypothetical protein E4T56_gene20315 [Termitomyces sp. T112]
MRLRPLPPLTPPPKPTQPTNPHRVTLVLTLGPPTSSPMKEPLIPRRNNPWNEPRSISTEASHSPTNPRAAPAQKKHPPIQLQQTSKLEGVSEIHKTPLTDDTETSPLQTYYRDHYPGSSATRPLGTPSSDQLRPEDKPHPTTPTIIKKDPRHPATCIGTKAGLQEDPAPPASHNRRSKPRPPRTHVGDPEVHPLEPAQHTSLLQTGENPYTLGPRPWESNPATPPKSATELCRKTPNTPAEPWNSFYGTPPHPDNPRASQHRWH